MACFISRLADKDQSMYCDVTAWCWDNEADIGHPMALGHPTYLWRSSGDYWWHYVNWCLHFSVHFLLDMTCVLSCHK